VNKLLYNVDHVRFVCLNFWLFSIFSNHKKKGGERDEEEVGDCPHKNQEASEAGPPGSPRQRKLLHLRLVVDCGPTWQGRGFALLPCSLKQKQKGACLMHKLLRVETAQNVFEIQFGQIQFEITGRCNLKCKHCRAAGDELADVDPKQIAKIMEFARRYSPPHAEVIVSGGEPLIHRQFREVLEIVRSNGGDSMTLTTNGLLVNREILRFLAEMNFEKLILSVSLDSLNPAEHDTFRGKTGAFDLAVGAIKQIVEANIPNAITSARVTLRPEQIAEMEMITQYVFSLGCKRISFSSIHPSGRAKDSPELWVNTSQLRLLVETIYRLRRSYPRWFQIGTNDPLKCLLRGRHDIGSGNELVYDGCAAGAVTFNVNASGIMTPCALLNIPIMQTRGMTVEQIAEAYKHSPIVHNLLEMNLTGKCGKCDLKFQCGGCRARALTRNGDYLAEDPCCWK